MPLGIAHGNALNLPQARYILPSFVERTSYGVKESNPYNKLFEERIIFLGVQIDDASANDVMAQLLTLESTDPDRDIIMYINSPGGSFTSHDGDLRHDAVRPPAHPDGVPRPGGVGGRRAAGRRHAGQAARAAELPHPDPPARHRGRLRPGLRPGDPGQGDPADAHARWRRSWPGTRTRRRRRSARTSTATRSSPRPRPRTTA